MTRAIFTLGLRLQVLIVGGLVTGGCSSTFPWIDRGGSSPTVEKIPDPTPDDDGGAKLLGAKGASGDGLRFIDLVFDVVRIDFPLKGIRHCRKIWNHVDELRMGSEANALLGRNGFRIGAGSPDAWPAIRAIIAAAGAQVRRDQLVAQRGLPLLIELARIEKDESIFCYGRDNRLTGKTFRSGQKVLTLDYSFHPHLGGCTDLRIALEVRDEPDALTWERRGGVIRELPDAVRHTFKDVAASITLNSDEFLVIGMSDQAPGKHLIGSSFLALKQGGKDLETVLCITPRPYRTKGWKQ